MLVGGSAYSLYDRPTFRRGCYSQEWELHVHSSFKNYDGEIKHFLDWIEPHVADVHQFLGYYRYEQDTAPTLIYISDAGKIVTQPIGAPEGLDG